MENFLNEMKNVDRCSINGKAAGMGAAFVNLANVKDLGDDKEEAVKTLQKFFKELKKVNAEFGYRTATEIFRYIAQAKKNDDTDGKLTNHDILDAAIIQKLLPKLHGSRKKLEPVLAQLWKLCFTEEVHIARENVDKAIYKESADKILRMYEAANANGFTSFAEA
jgi:5-methylcytosine-specific restriction protein B